MGSRAQAAQPVAERTLSRGERGQRRPSTVDQQGAQVFVAAFGDAEQPRPAAGGGLSRDEPQQAARSRARAKLRASPMAATSAVAFKAPIPGMVDSRRAA